MYNINIQLALRIIDINHKTPILKAFNNLFMQKLDLSPLRTAAPFIALAIGGCGKKAEEAPRPSPQEDISAETARETQRTIARTVDSPDEREPLGPKPECWADLGDEIDEDTRLTIRFAISRSHEDWRPLDTDDPIMKDPDIVALASQFEEEARRQIKRVKDAGGFCNLPKKFPDQTETGDDRLGTPLQDIVQRRNELLAARFPDVQMYWSVDLGRAMCEAAQAPTLFREDLIPRNKWRGLRAAIEPLARRFNQMCIAAFEGRSLTTKPLKSDPLAVRRLLVRRGEAIAGALDRDGLSTIERLWREKCKPHQGPGDEALSDEEFAQLLGSHLLMDEVVPSSEYQGRDGCCASIYLDNRRGHAWRCEVGLLDGFDDNYWEDNKGYCGVVRRCVAFPGAQQVQDGEWEAVPGRFETIHIAARKRRGRE